MKINGPVYKSPVAGTVPYDNSNSGLTADEVQAAIDELATGGGSTASPGFTYGRSGTINAGAYLLNETVPSNVSGRTIFLNNAKITDISVATETDDTYTVSIEEHDGVTYTVLTTVSIVAMRTKVISGLSVSVTKGKQLAAKVSSGAAKNLVVNLQLRGTV